MSSSPRAERRLALPDGELAFEEGGGGPAVLFLHGWTLDRRMWRPQLDALSARYRTLAIDRRGFGASSAPADLSREPQDVLRLLDALQIERCALVGMSQGGRVALRIAHAHPDRLWALCLQGAPLDGFAPGPSPQEAIPISAYKAMVAAGAIQAMRAAWREHPLMEFPDHPARAELETIVAGYDGRDLRAEPGKRFDANLAAELHSIEVATLVLTGEHDTEWLQLVGDALAYGLPRAERARLAGAGHMANMSHAASYNACLAEFFARQAASA